MRQLREFKVYIIIIPSIHFVHFVVESIMIWWYRSFCTALLIPLF
jgi:hypothetical protein